jgi:hypothetical protein
MPPYAETHEYARRVIEQYTNDMRAQAAVAPVLILVGPKPYVMPLRPGSIAAQPEPAFNGVLPTSIVIYIAAPCGESATETCGSRTPTCARCIH